jgi:hypothetical protein
MAQRALPRPRPDRRRGADADLRPGAPAPVRRQLPSPADARRDPRPRACVPHRKAPRTRLPGRARARSHDAPSTSRPRSLLSQARTSQRSYGAGNQVPRARSPRGLLLRRSGGRVVSPPVAAPSLGERPRPVRRARWPRDRCQALTSSSPLRPAFGSSSDSEWIRRRPAPRGKRTSA